jgi:glycosyltransferase involved in cell wall biosynthesis
MTQAPLISVIVPSFNLAAFLPRTLDSILGQSYRPVEIVVVDGGSSDGTVEILRDYSARHPEVRWISEPDEGPAEAVNKGLALARGEIGAIQSADDVYTPDVFEEIVSTFERYPDHGMIYGHCHGLDERDRVVATAKYPPFSWESLFAIAFALPQSSVFFRMSIARQTGGWNPAYYSADVDFWMRIALRTQPLLLDRVLSAWRVRPGQRTRPEHYQALWDGYWRSIAECQDLKGAPRRVRRLAKASRHLLALKFHPTGNKWSVRWHVARALPGHPTFWRYYDAGYMRTLVPGLRGVETFLRKLRRRIRS